MSWAVTTGGYTRDMVRDVMPQTVEPFRESVDG
ncbi:hypothetical protein SAMN06265784_11955 [Paraburkholderia susongensis]|uniref:Uncharacterized protein n=1 Tax=Paraburkholderia susongensis TaxID=1515439 RepID=A0A1X7M6F0_9BURK|nr:hypothetical protein SAMN06265784_11955 [Paraburkholderia susongensis]